jgi:hypothetical protein
MELPGHTLFRRVTGVLVAKQHLVFLAIGLYSLDFAAPLLAAWLYRRAPLEDLLRTAQGPLADAVAGRSAAAAAVLVAYLLLAAWLRAGYIRSITGPVHLRPRDTRQFLRLLALLAGLEALGAAAVAIAALAGGGAAAGQALIFALLAVYLVVLYADYVIVIADVGPLQAIAQSWHTVRHAPLPSALVLLTVTLIGGAATALLAGLVAADLLHSLPLLVVRCVIVGAVAFVADVTLIVLYLRAVEQGRAEAGSAW